MLGITIAVLAFSWDMIIINLLDTMRERFFKSDFYKNKLQKWLGFIYIVLGFKLLLSSKE